MLISQIVQSLGRLYLLAQWQLQCFHLGTGLGLSSVSPWAQEGVSATSFGGSTIVSITVMSLAASGIGGYLAGRLCTKWVGVHTNEVYFRDTAHGLLAWAVATLVTAALLSSVVGTVVSGDVKAGASVVGGMTSAEQEFDAEQQGQGLAMQHSNSTDRASAANTTAEAGQ